MRAGLSAYLGKKPLKVERKSVSERERESERERKRERERERESY